MDSADLAGDRVDLALLSNGSAPALTEERSVGSIVLIDSRCLTTMPEEFALQELSCLANRKAYARRHMPSERPASARMKHSTRRP